MWQQWQPFGSFRGACPENHTRKQRRKSMWTSNPLPHMPVGRWVVWASVQVPWSGCFYGAKWQRTKEGQDLWTASGKLPRTVQPCLPLKSLLWSEGSLGSLPSPVLLWHGTALRGRDFAKHWLFCPVSPLLSSSCPNVVTLCQQAGWGGWGGRVFIIAKWLPSVILPAAFMNPTCFN